jgi:hypothetical protein
MTRTIQDEMGGKMPPELELVICIARPKGLDNEDRIRALLGEGVNWNEVLAYALQHKLGLILCKRLHELGESWLTRDQREALIEIERQLGTNSLRLLGEMLLLQGVFEAGQIPAIPYKGPSLAWLAYQNFTFRTYSDLDFVVPQRYIPKAVLLLQAAGYNAEFDPREVREGRQGHAPGQYAFVSGTSHRLVELHTERTLRYFPCPLNLDEMNARLIQLKIGGQNISTFSVEDTLVMLCVHGAKHFWEQLSWIADVANLVTAQPVDWPLTMQIAADLKCSRLLLLGLSLAHELFKAPLPKSVLESAQHNANVQWLARMVREQYTDVSGLSVGVLPRAAFRLRSRDGIGQGLRHMLRLAMSPTESDRQTVRLPQMLAPLYALVRPLRLLRNYGLGLRRLQLDLADFEPTPPEVVDRMLEFADIAPGDVLYDLGCGDGRIVVAAAGKFGIRSVGVDIDPLRIAEAKANARQQGVKDRVRFLQADAKNVDISEATIVTLYLELGGVLKLAERLRSQLRPGARIVSRSSQIFGWNPDRSETCTSASGIRTVFYLWTIKEADKDVAAGEDTVQELRQTHRAGG